jgi:hypothetical protein
MPLPSWTKGRHALPCQQSCDFNPNGLPFNLAGSSWFVATHSGLSTEHLTQGRAFRSTWALNAIPLGLSDPQRSRKAIQGDATARNERLGYGRSHAVGLFVMDLSRATKLRWIADS